jgi:hypothetical protein
MNDDWLFLAVAAVLAYFYLVKQPAAATTDQGTTTTPATPSPTNLNVPGCATCGSTRGNTQVVGGVTAGGCIPGLEWCPSLGKCIHGPSFNDYTPCPTVTSPAVPVAPPASPCFMNNCAWQAILDQYISAGAAANARGDYQTSAAIANQRAAWLQSIGVNPNV